MRLYGTQVAVLGCLHVLNVGGTSIARAQSTPVQPERGAHGGQVIRASDHQVELRVDSLGLMQVWLLNTRAEPDSVPANATATLRGGGDRYSITLRPDSAGRRLVGRFNPHHFRIFEVELSLPVAGKRRTLRFPYPSDLPFHSHH